MLFYKLFIFRGLLRTLHLKFYPDLIVIPLYRRAVHAQLSGNHALAGHAGVLPQIGSDGLLLGAEAVGMRHGNCQGCESNVFESVGPAVPGDDSLLFTTPQILSGV